MWYYLACRDNPHYILVPPSMQKIVLLNVVTAQWNDVDQPAGEWAELREQCDFIWATRLVLLWHAAWNTKLTPNCAMSDAGRTVNTLVRMWRFMWVPLRIVRKLPCTL